MEMAGRIPKKESKKNQQQDPLYSSDSDEEGNKHLEGHLETQEQKVKKDTKEKRKHSKDFASQSHKVRLNMGGDSLKEEVNQEMKGKEKRKLEKSLGSLKNPSQNLWNRQKSVHSKRRGQNQQVVKK
eukprot:CAMPEP_0117748368 /NCGR_PEP_ID=MMETSP0947-20121206/9068_1 /TAXON_ID=44440 /ORGANISM="Chattonella subsalsa, Strain CCMP2191" /LENGTH=126 /DNA_ID=CAMNT_0005566005 /DNA_START=132 /DNA_END=509 /DNA_ORIENTATION=-